MEYISAILQNGQVILGQVEDEIDDNGFYTFHNPLKPIILTESNKIALVQMNPFSDSIEFKIHESHVMSLGALQITYIDVYNNAVNTIEESLLAKYKDYTETSEEPQMDEYDNVLNDLNESKTIH